MTGGPLDGGEIVLQALRDLGVDYVFSSPGSEWSPVWEAMARQDAERRPGPRFFDCWHEMVAVDMALGYTAVTGRGQAVLLHAGFGVLHAAMGIYSATQAELPLLVMSGESVTFGEAVAPPVEPQFYSVGVSVGGAHRLIGPLVKWSGQVTAAATLYHSVCRAMELAHRSPVGPTYLNVSLECLLERSDVSPRAVAPAGAKVPTHEAIARVAARLAEAKRPMILAEAVGRSPAAFAALRAFAEAFGIGVVSMRYGATASFPKESTMWLGEEPLPQDTDVVLLVGARAPWYPPSQRPAATVIALGDHALKPHLAYQVLAADEYLEGDIAETLRLLYAAMDPDAATVAARSAWVTQAHDALLARLAADVAKHHGRMTAVTLAAVTAEVLPPDAVICDETITHMPEMRTHLPLNDAHGFYRVTGSALGQGIATALGIKLALPRRPVVLFIGDGSFLYNPITQALGAAQAFGLPLIIVVCNNRRYEAMRRGRVFYFGPAEASDLPYGVQIHGPAYETLGAALGVDGARATTPDEFRIALQNALATGRSTIVNVTLE